MKYCVPINVLAVIHLHVMCNENVSHCVVSLSLFFSLSHQYFLLLLIDQFWKMWLIFGVLCVIHFYTFHFLFYCLKAVTFKCLIHMSSEIIIYKLICWFKIFGKFVFFFRVVKWLNRWLLWCFWVRWYRKWLSTSVNDTHQNIYLEISFYFWLNRILVSNHQRWFKFSWVTC